MKKLSITILVCFISTFIIAGTTTINNTNKSIANMKTSNTVIKVMTYNILEGAYPTGPPSYTAKLPAYNLKDRADAIIGFIKSKNPDILLLQECNHWADKGNKRLQRFSTELGMPYKAIAPNHGNYNVAVLSKYPITNYTYLSDDIYYYWNILTATIQLTPSTTIEAASTHFGWWGVPGYSKMTVEQKKQAYIKQKAVLMAYLQKKFNGNLIIGGDWNHGATQSPFDQGNLHDAIADLGYGKNLLHLFHPKENPIDNIYTSQSGRFTVLSCNKFPAAGNFSDHLPVMAKISIATVKDVVKK